MSAPDANAVPVYTNEPPSPSLVQTRPTFHVSREMVCFLGGIGVALGVMYLLSQMNKRGRD